jgi:hypothetical protein
MCRKDNWEPQRTNNFELIIYDLDKVPEYRGNSAGMRMQGRYLNANGQWVRGTGSPVTLSKTVTENLKLTVRDFSAPTMELSVIEVGYGNNKAKYAGTPTFGGGSITYNDFIGLNTEKILTSWWNQGYNTKTQAVGRASKYKKDATIFEYDPSGVFVRSWNLYGCWLKSFDLGQYSNENNDKRALSCAIEYDFCTLNDPSANSYEDTADIYTEYYGGKNIQY